MSNPVDLLKEAAAEAGRTITVTSNYLRAFIADEAITLATISGELGYYEAVKASAHLVAIEAGLGAIDIGDATDERIRGIIIGLLTAAASA